MPRETPAAIVRAHAADLIARFVRVGARMRRSETDVLEIGRELLALREACIQAGREWLQELARSDIPRSTAHRYMQLAAEADQPPDESDTSTAAHDGQDESEEDGKPRVPVRRRKSAGQKLDEADDTPRVRAARRVLDGLDQVQPALAQLDLADYQAHDAALVRLRRDVTRAATC